MKKIPTCSIHKTAYNCYLPDISKDLSADYFLPREFKYQGQLLMAFSVEVCCYETFHMNLQ